MAPNLRRLGSLFALAALVASGCSASSSPLPTSGPSVASAGIGSPPATPKPPVATVTLALDWTPNTNHTGFYVAQYSGWYAHAAIDLQLIPYASANPETLVG